MTKPDFAYDTYIRTTPEKLWAALTEGEFTRRYFHATEVRSSWKVGDPVVYHDGSGKTVVDGEVLEAEPPRRLAITWKVYWSEALSAEPPSRVTFEIEASGEVCGLRVRHDRFEPGSQVFEEIRAGWPAILGSLKSLLETGQALPLAGNA